MAQLRQDYQEFINRQTEVVVIGPDNRAAFAAHWRDNSMPFIGLPDPDVTVLTGYGQKVNLFKLGRMPAQAVVDKNGVVKYVYYGNSMSDITGNSEILALLDQLNRESETTEKPIEQDLTTIQPPA